MVGLKWTGNILSWDTVKHAARYNCKVEVNDGKETTSFYTVVTGNSIDVENVLKEKKYAGKLIVTVTVVANPEDTKTYKSGEGVKSSELAIELEAEITQVEEVEDDGSPDAKINTKAVLKTLKLNKKNKKLSVGKSFKIKLSKKFDVTNLKKIKYKSSKKKIVKVAKNGQVKALAKGKAEVKVTVVLIDGTKKVLKCKMVVK